VAVVGPSPGHVLAESNGEALGRADSSRVNEGSVGRLPAMAVNVEGVEADAQWEDVPLHDVANTARNAGVFPMNARPLIVMN
jgi:hypothetical protein